MELDVHGLRIGSWTSPLGLLLLLYLPTYLPKSSRRHDIRSGTCVGAVDTEAFHNTLPIHSFPSIHTFSRVRSTRSRGWCVRVVVCREVSITWTLMYAFTWFDVDGT
jgi:hypothetical protein